MDLPAYSCSVCGLAVIVIAGSKPIRACKCEGAKIFANMSGKLTVLMGAAERKPSK